MPDLDRERRLRSRQALDKRCIFALQNGYRGPNGRWVSTPVSWSSWCRREDRDAEERIEHEPTGARSVAAVVLIIRYDARLQNRDAGAQVTYDGRRYQITQIEDVGRRRYMRVHGSSSR